MRPLAEIEAQIARAMKLTAEEGWTFAPGALMRLLDKECCALGAVGCSARLVKATLGISDAVFDEIADGFDAQSFGYEPPSGIDDTPYRMGQRLRLLGERFNADRGVADDH